MKFTVPVLCLDCVTARRICIVFIAILLPTGLLRAQGTLINGYTHQAMIAPVGDIDVWTFAANSGDHIVIRGGEISQSTALTVRLSLMNPSGVQVATSSGSFSTEIMVVATNSGTFALNVEDVGADGTGLYRLTLAKTGEAVVTAAGDEGGVLTNGVQQVCGLPTGDLDVWTFTADDGDNIVVRAGETNAGSLLTPWVRLFSPTGALLDSDTGASAGEVTFRATNSGAFMVVMADANYAGSESLAYRLTLAKTGEAVVTAAGDEGGALTNGVQNVCGLPTGDLDLWTFTADVGDSIVVRAGETNAGSLLTPWVRLFSPTGVLLDSDTGSSAGEVTFRATNSGMFMVVMADANDAGAESLAYRLTLAKTGEAVVTAAGDEGGALTNGVQNVCGLLTGDLDVWTFTACQGDVIDLQITELTGGTGFTPSMRLYAPNGALTNAVSGSTTAQISRTVPLTGTYILIVGNNAAGAGNYQLTGTGVSTGFILCRPVISGANVIIRSAGGPATSNYILFATMNVALPFNEWTPIHTNQFSAYGEFSVTNLFSPAKPQEYFWVRTP